MEQLGEKTAISGVRNHGLVGVEAEARSSRTNEPDRYSKRLGNSFSKSYQTR